MRKDERDLLEVLKFELEFLEKGGYGLSPRTPRRPQFMFEDSPSCMNYDSKEEPAPCEECILMRLVPEADRKNPIPCRFIPMDESGETLDSLYRHGNQHEIEEMMRGWLRATIQRLDECRNPQPTPQTSAAGGFQRIADEMGGGEENEVRLAEGGEGEPGDAEQCRDHEGVATVFVRIEHDQASRIGGESRGHEDDPGGERCSHCPALAAANGDERQHNADNRERGC
jgi:hypothetical protein